MSAFSKLVTLVAATLALSIWIASGASSAVNITGTTRDSFGAARTMQISIRPMDQVGFDSPFAQVPLALSTNSAADGTFTIPLLPGNYQWTVGNTRPFPCFVPTNAVGPYNISEVTTNAYVNIYSTNTSGFILYTAGLASNLTVYGTLTATGIVSTAQYVLLWDLDSNGNLSPNRTNTMGGNGWTLDINGNLTPQ